MPPSRSSLHLPANLAEWPPHNPARPLLLLLQRPRSGSASSKRISNSRMQKSRNTTRRKWKAPLSTASACPESFSSICTRIVELLRTRTFRNWPVQVLRYLPTALLEVHCVNLKLEFKGLVQPSAEPTRAQRFNLILQGDFHKRPMAFPSESPACEPARFDLIGTRLRSSQGRTRCSSRRWRLRR